MCLQSLVPGACCPFLSVVWSKTKLLVSGLWACYSTRAYTFLDPQQFYATHGHFQFIRPIMVVLLLPQGSLSCTNHLEIIQKLTDNL